jgi:hypothetical protein
MRLYAGTRGSLCVKRDKSSCAQPLPCARAWGYPNELVYHQKMSFRYSKPFHSFCVNRLQKDE